MNELHLSGAWSTILGIQVACISLFAFSLFKSGTTKKAIDFATGIIQKHTNADCIPHLLEGTADCEHQLRVDKKKVTHQHYDVLKIGAVVVIVTFLMAVYLGNISLATKNILTNEHSYQQKSEILSIKPAEWSKLAKSQNINSKAGPNTLNLKQGDLSNFKRLLFENSHSLYYEAFFWVICLLLTGLPFLWEARIKRRVFRNSAYIAASYAYATTQSN